MADPVRDALIAQIRAQYNTGQGGSGSWDDGGIDRAGELADLLISQGVTSLGDMKFVDTPYEETLYNGIQGDGGPAPEAFTNTGINRQLQIGDRTVGFLGDYNNDGTYGSNAGDYLQYKTGPDGYEENLLGWSATGDGNTSYRAIQHPDTGQIYLVPGWNSSSSTDIYRQLGIAAAGMMLGGAGMTGTLAGAAGATGGAGAALSGAATGAGMQMATTGELGTDTLRAGLLGGATGYLVNAGGELFNGSGVDPYGPGSGWGQDTFSNMGMPLDYNAAGGAIPQFTPGTYGYDPTQNYFGLDTGLGDFSNIDGTAFYDAANGNFLLNPGPGFNFDIGNGTPVNQAPTNNNSTNNTPTSNSPLNNVLTNPRLIGAGLGAVAGLLDDGESGGDGGGGDPYNGPMPTMSSVGWSPTATPQYMQVPTFGSNFMANQPVGHTNSGLWRYMNGAQPNAGLPQQGLMQTPQTPGRQQSLGLLGGQQQPQQQGLMTPQQMAPLVQQSYQAADQGFSGSGFVGTGGAPISDHYTWGGDPSARILVDNTVHQNGLYGGPNGMSLQDASAQGYYQARDDKTGEYLWVKAGQMSPYAMTGTVKVDQGGRTV